jgi:hypothetical protein
MLGSEGFFEQSEGPHQEGSRGKEFALGCIERGQIVQAFGGVWMVRAECFFPDLERALD